MKRNLLKALGISFLIFVLLSWLIPVGVYTNGALDSKGIDPVGLFDLFNTPTSAFVTFVLYGVVFMAMGGLYGVMEKTGALEKLVSKMKGAFTGKEKLFLVLTVVLFTVLSSVTGLILPLFVLVPLFALVLKELNYEKVTALAATVGSLLVGSVASTYGFNISGYTKNILSLSMNDQIVAKVVLLVVLTALLAVMLVCASKKVLKKTSKTKEVRKEEPKKVSTKKATKPAAKSTTKTAAKKKTTAKKTSKKSTTKALAVTKPVKKVSSKSKLSVAPLVVILVLMLIVTLVGMYNWYYAFGIETFNNMYEAVMNVKIKDFPIFEHLFSGSSQFGYWSNVNFVGMMVLASMLIAWIYKLSLNDYVESFIAGVKKWLPTAIYASLASVILSILYQASYNGTGTLVDTVNDKLFGLFDGFNVLTTGAAAFLGSFFFNDLYYLLADLAAFVSGFDASTLPIVGLLIQSMYSIGMLVFPTSVVLIAGLSLFDVSYKQWIKYIWKFVLTAFLLVLLVCGILTLL